MSKDKYPSIFSRQMATIVFIILQIFCATRAVLKIGEYSRIFPSFSWRIFGHVFRPIAREQKDLMDYKLGYLFAEIICSEKRTVFQKRSSRKTVSYEEQITSKDKYPIIFSPQMEAIVFIVLQIFFATRAVFKIVEYLVNKPLQAAGMSADNVRG